MDFNEMKNTFGFMPRRVPMTPRPVYYPQFGPSTTAPFTVQPTPIPTGDVPSTTIASPDFEVEPGAPVQTDINYTQGYLESKIGEYVKIEFLIGTDLLIDREGILKDVGISYIVLQESGTNDELMADLYSIKFVRIFDQPSQRPQAQVLR